MNALKNLALGILAFTVLTLIAMTGLFMVFWFISVPAGIIIILVNDKTFLGWFLLLAPGFCYLLLAFADAFERGYNEHRYRKQFKLNKSEAENDDV